MKMWMYLLCMLLVLTGCEHRELSDPDGGHYLRVYLDEHIRNVSFGFYDETKEKPEYRTPEAIRATLSDPVTGRVVKEGFLFDSGKDEKGNYLAGYIDAEPGNYHLLAYNYDTESTHVKQEYSYEGMEVYTNLIDESLKNRLQCVRSAENPPIDPIRYEPDHFFVAGAENVRIQDTNERDTIFTNEGEHPVASTLVKTYYIQINVKGVEYVQSAVAVITGMAGSTKLHDRSMVSDNVASVYFNLQNGYNKNRTNEVPTVAYANFNTFGKLPETEGYIEITFEFKTKFNTVQTETIRLTDMFETHDVKVNQWIIIDKIIEIIPPDGDDGGMTPGVGKWEEIEGTIII